MQTAAANIIRSTFCAEGVRGGTRLFLTDEGKSFLISTNFQIVGRRKRLVDAIALFEATAMGRA